MHFTQLSTKLYLLRQGFIIMQILITQEIVECHNGRLHENCFFVFLTQNDSGGKVKVKMKNSALKQNNSSPSLTFIFIKYSIFRARLAWIPLNFDPYYLEFSLDCDPKYMLITFYKVKIII